MVYKNNKGFSLIEVLVTVGLIGILVGIAVPSYNKYKANTMKMAIKADVGAGQKVYSAKYAVDSSYCHTFADVGLSENKEENPIYKNKGFYGFGALASGADVCSVSGDLAAVQFISPGDGTCSDASKTSKPACDTAGGTWTAKAATGGTNAPACILGTNNFKIGGYTDASKLNTMVQADQDGKITEHPAKIDCQ